MIESELFSSTKPQDLNSGCGATGQMILTS